MKDFNITDDILKLAAEIADREIGESLKDPEEEIVFSPEHEEKMHRLFRRERRKISRRKFAKFAARAACVLLVIAIGCGVTVYNVEAWRLRFLNFVLEKDKPNSAYNFKEGGGINYSDDDVALNYVPMGFSLKRKDETSLSLFYLFESEDKYFYFETHSLDTDGTMDTENAVVEKTKVNGYDALFVSKNLWNMLIWCDSNAAYSVTGDISREEIEKIAKDAMNFKKY